MNTKRISTLAVLAAAAAAMVAGPADAQSHGGDRGGGGGGFARGGAYRGGGYAGGAYRGGGSYGYGRGGYYGYGRGGYWGGYWGGYFAPWFWGAYPAYGYLYPYPYPYYDYPPPPPEAYYAPPPPGPEQPAPARAPARPQRFVVYFPFDKADLTPDAREVIRAAADYAARNPGGHVIIVGHTDTSGSEAYNQPLSERRARAVCEALGGDGLDTTAVEMDWKGKHDLAVDTGDGVKEPRNRRVTILIEPDARDQADAGDDPGER